MEDQYQEKARRLRDDPATHYNCAQTVIMAFADELDISDDRAAALGVHFGGGMKMGSVCGAISGGAMVLGLMGATDGQYRAFLQAMRDLEGAVDCAELLRRNAQAGGNRRDFCDGIIFEAVDTICRVMGNEAAYERERLQK